MAKNPKKGNPLNNAGDMSDLMQKINDAVRIVIEQYKAENPDVDVEALLSKNNGLAPILGAMKNRELDRFVAYAKGQGTKMPFDAMEMGVLAAGRRDMQNGLAEILNAAKFDKPECPECGEKTDDRGRGKKNS